MTTKKKKNIFKPREFNKNIFSGSYFNYFNMIAICNIKNQCLETI